MSVLATILFLGLWLTAIITESHSIISSEPSTVLNTALPSSPILFSTEINLTPLSNISTGDLNNVNSTPSSCASLISSFVAVISSKPFLYTTVTSQPLRFATLAASIATLPAPITMTFLPNLKDSGDIK